MIEAATNRGFTKSIDSGATTAFNICNRSEFICNFNSENDLVNNTVYFNVLSNLADALNEYGNISQTYKTWASNRLSSITIPSILIAMIYTRHYQLEATKELVYYVNKYQSSVPEFQNRDIGSMDIATLMNATTPTIQVQSCLLGSVADVDVVLQNLESTFCDYKNVLGTTTDLTKTYGQPFVCVNGSTKQLMNPKVGMSNMTGWNNTPTSVAQTIQNMWLTICDMRGAVKAILDTCCQVSCESISIKISYKWIDQNTLRLFFTGSTLPMGFYDCDQTNGTMFTLTDGLGNTSPVYIKLRNSDPTIMDGVLDDLTNVPLYHFDVIDISSTTPLDVTTGLVLTSDACFTIGDSNCIKCLSVNIAAYVNKDCCTLTATAPVTITYKIC